MARCTIEKIERVGAKPPTTTIAKIDVSVSGTAGSASDIRLYEVGNDADAADCVVEGPATSLGNWTLLVTVMRGSRYEIYASDYDNNPATRSLPKTVDWTALIK